MVNMYCSAMIISFSLRVRKYGCKSHFSKKHFLGYDGYRPKLLEMVIETKCLI